MSPRCILFSSSPLVDKSSPSRPPFRGGCANPVWSSSFSFARCPNLIRRTCVEREKEREALLLHFLEYITIFTPSHRRNIAIWGAPTSITKSNSEGHPGRIWARTRVYLADRSSLESGSLVINSWDIFGWRRPAVAPGNALSPREYRPPIAPVLLSSLRARFQEYITIFSSPKNRDRFSQRYHSTRKNRAPTKHRVPKIESNCISWNI